MYIIGGLTLTEGKFFNSSSSIDKFCFLTKKWEKVSNMSDARWVNNLVMEKYENLLKFHIIFRHGHSIACVSDKIFIFGGVSMGRTFKYTLDSVECFSCKQNGWIKGIQKLPIPLSGFDSISIKYDTEGN